MLLRASVEKAVAGIPDKPILIVRTFMSDLTATDPKKGLPISKATNLQIH